MRRRLYDEEAVLEKFGVGPASIPDWLALVGDSADGIPGIPRWGARSAGLLLRRYVHLEAIPDDERQWDVGVRGAPALAESLRDRRQEAIFYRCLATLRTDVELAEGFEDLRWRGVRGGMLGALCEEIGDSEIQGRLAGLLQRTSL
jgi:5'-3' exonuclease